MHFFFFLGGGGGVVAICGQTLAAVATVICWLYLTLNQFNRLIQSYLILFDRKESYCSHFNFRSENILDNCLKIEPIMKALHDDTLTLLSWQGSHIDDLSVSAVMSLCPT